MQGESVFRSMPHNFWAYVRLISQDTGYSKSGVIVVPGERELLAALKKRGLSVDDIHDGTALTDFGTRLMEYFVYRADVLNRFVEPRLRDAGAAKLSYESIVAGRTLSCPQPMNKQKGSKRAFAYLTCIVNAILEQSLGGSACDFDPRELLVGTSDRRPVRTLARRVDGAFPSVVDPVAVWEIKEYWGCPALVDTLASNGSRHFGVLRPHLLVLHRAAVAERRVSPVRVVEAL
ncbi:MAG TPA: hypothetical protein VGK50_05295, partial [Coriobacteriia bacterium]